jgi:hypothetical protein
MHRNLSHIRIDVPQRNQGQIVEVGFGWDEGQLYRRVKNQNDGSILWYVAEEESEWEPGDTEGPTEVAEQNWRELEDSSN